MAFEILTPAQIAAGKKSDKILDTVKASPVDWNNIEDPVDKEVWDKLTENFWLPEKVPLSNDVKSYNDLPDAEKKVMQDTYGMLTLLDTIQSTVGAAAMIGDALTPHEEAVYTNIVFMESVHAKSYSSIFSTLCSKEENDAIFRWTENNELIQNMARIQMNFYTGLDPIKRKIAGTVLEGYLFYTGFFTPFYMGSRNKLPNTADLLGLIFRDERIHCYYTGYKYQKMLEPLSQEEKDKYKEIAFDYLLELIDNMEAFLHELYDDVGWSEDAISYSHFNANTTLKYLGYEPLFPPEASHVDPGVMGYIASDNMENHDFFSGSGSTYVIGEVESTTDDDWDF
ncbi:MAG: class 1b ribonucleoside-diphosphate reductase subunit beta [Lawsonella sp.]|nr:class 1b ribonucleoside-diphosphate reductase subunit beta [Mycobacteriales bacterium]